VDHEPWEVGALFLVGEERGVLGGDESLDVGVVNHALGSVFETHVYVVVNLLTKHDVTLTDHT